MRSKSKDFLELICEFEYHMDKVWHKLPGIAPATVNKALKAYDSTIQINDYIIFKNGMNRKKKGIILYSFRSGAHYVAIRKQDKKYTFYNGSPDSAGSIDEFMKSGKSRSFWTGFYY